MADRRTIKFTLVVDGDGVVRQVNTTAGAFTQMGAAAQAAAAQTQQGLRQVDQATKAAEVSQAAFISGLREQVALYGKSEGDVLRYRAAQAGVAQQASMLILQLENQKAAHQQAAMAAMQEQAAQREAAAAKRAAEQASDAFVASLREQVATLGLSRTELLAYRAAQLGVAAEAAPMIARLSQAEQVTGKYGMSAGQLSQAMRMLPMQMTDVVTSLASGMPVWMVAIQQGGQLRDSFGGIGPMLRAVASAVGPVGLALGAVAAVLGLTALAWSQGEREASAYSQALILTGNYVGKTRGELGDMAQQLAGVNGTVGAHAAALAELAATGKVTGAVIGELGAAAVAMESATGKAVSASVAEFVRLGEEPAKASAKLNEQYHYLTASVYAQIVALEKAGKADEAAELAQRTYASAMQERAGRVRESLGYLETAWAAVGRAANRAWDFMLNIGRESSTADRLAESIEKVATARERLEGMKALASTSPGAIAAAERALQLEENRVVALRQAVDWEGKSAAAQAANVRANDKAIAQQTAQADILKRYASDSEKLKDALDEAAKAFGGVVPPDVEARIRASFKGIGAAAKKELDEAAKAVTAYKNLVGDLTGKDSGLNADFNDKLEVLRKGWRAGADEAEGYRAAVRQLIEQQPFFIKGEQDALRLAQQASAARVSSRASEEAAIAAWQAQQTSAYQAAVQGSNAALAAAQREFDQYGMSKAQIAEVTLATLRLTQAKLRDGSEGYAALQRQIDAQEQLVAVLRRGEARDASVQAAKDATAAWQAFADDIDRDLTGSLSRALEAGKGFGESFFASLRNMAKTAAIKVAVQLVAGGSSVGGTVASFLNGGSSSGNSIVDVANTGSSLVNLASAGAGLWGSSAAYGAALGTTSIGAGSQAAMLAAQTGVFGSAGVGATAAAAGGTAGTAMSAVAAAAPYIAAVMAVYALAEKYTKGETRSGGQYAVGTTSTGTYSDAYTTFLQGPSGGEIQGDQVKAAINATVAGINSTLKAVGSAASLTGFQAALESSDKGRGGVYAGGTLSTGATFGELGLGGGRNNYNGTLYETTSATSLDSAAALKNFTTDLLQATVQALQAAADIPQTISDMLAGVDAESLSAEAASALLANVNAMAAFSAAVDALPFENLKNMSFSAADGLLELMGGVDGLSAALGGYFEAYYTEAERQQQSVANVQRVFTELGLTMPTLAQSGEAARAQFRQLVEAQDLNTEQGRQAYAALMGVSSAYAELTPLGLEAAASVDAVTGEVRVLSQTMIDLGREHASLQDQYNKLTLSQADYRAQAIASYSAEEQAAAAANFALEDRIAAIQAESAAQAQAAQQREAMSQQLAGLEIQLLQAQSNTAEVRRRELEALDPSLRAIQELINARNDEVAASQAATQAAAAAAQAAQAVAQERYALETRLLQAQGDTAALRERELAAINPANQALQRQIYALEDQASRAAQAEQALQALNAQTQALAQQAAAVAAERAGIEREYLQITGNTAALRQLELDALDPSNRALKERNFALQDQMAADQAAAAAAQQAAQAQQQAAQAAQQAAQQAGQAITQVAQQAQQAAQQVANEGLGIYKRLLALQGDTAALRAMELAELAPQNRALQEQVWALEDAQAALNSATTAQQGYTSAVADGAEFLAGVVRDVAAWVGKLRATSAGLTSPASQLRSARSQFEAQYALAAGGNRDALSGITGAADQLIDAQRATASSSLEVRQVIARLEARLTALPALVRPEALIVTAIEQQTSATTQQAVGLHTEAINAAVAANRAAIDAAIADADRLVAAAQAQAAAITANATGNATTQGAVTSAAVAAASAATVSALVANFDRLDSTANGLLSADELRAALGPLATDSVLRAVFSTLDADGDGQISRLEAIRANTTDLARGIASALDVSFNALDTSVDGLLSADELRAALGPLATDSVLRQIFTTLDVDGDGQISRLEAIRANTTGIGGSVAAALSGQFDRLDATADGLLDAAELRAALGPVASDSVLRQIFTTLDVDGDGQISRLEAIRTNTLDLSRGIASALAGSFAELDSSLDGLLDAGELRAALGPLATDSVLRDLLATTDADGDGQISRLEAIRANTSGLGASIAAALAGQFDKLDATANGLLDANELRAALGPLATDSVLRQVYATLDADGDGQISRLEAIRGAAALTADWAAWQGGASERQLNASNWVGGNTARQLDFSAWIGNTMAATLATLDADGDGQISRLEAIRGAAQLTADLTRWVGDISASTDGKTNAISANTGRQLDFSQWIGSTVAATLATLDADGDGQISRLEAIRGAAALTADLTRWVGNNTQWSADTNNWIGNTSQYVASLTEQQLGVAARVLDYSVEQFNRLGSIHALTDANGASIRTGNVYLDYQLQSLHAQYSLAIEVRGLTNAVTNATAATANMIAQIASGSAVLTVQTDKTIQPVDPGNPSTYFATGAAFLAPGVYQRPTTFGLGQLAEAGPEVIMPLANVGGMMGVRATAMRDDGAAAEVRQLRAEMADLLRRIENAATVGAVAQRGTEQALTRAVKFGLPVKNAAGTTLETA